VVNFIENTQLAHEQDSLPPKTRHDHRFVHKNSQKFTTEFSPQRSQRTQRKLE
jgi:hypothetical protein